MTITRDNQWQITVALGKVWINQLMAPGGEIAKREQVAWRD
jgi:hypothetical protein